MKILFAMILMLVTTLAGETKYPKNRISFGYGYGFSLIDYGEFGTMSRLFRRTVLMPGSHDPSSRSFYLSFERFLFDPYTSIEAEFSTQIPQEISSVYSGVYYFFPYESNFREKEKSYEVSLGIKRSIYPFKGRARIVLGLSGSYLYKSWISDLGIVFDPDNYIQIHTAYKGSVFSLNTILEYEQKIWSFIGFKITFAFTPFGSGELSQKKLSYETSWEDVEVRFPEKIKYNPNGSYRFGAGLTFIF